jgi:two-component system cell cycle response regulator
MTQSVLAIDDLPEIHQLLEVRLRPDPLRIHHAFTAEEGLRKAVMLQPDLILLDVDMPEVSGLELCRRLKADPSTAMIPIIFLTGADEVETKVAGFDLGAVDYITKPFDPAELRARVRAALRTKRYQDLLAARAQIDGLTGLWNRAYLNQRIAEEVAAAQRYHRKLCVTLLDLDHFKTLNDRFGHPFGDQVLQAVGEALTASTRTTDAACRYGGEEFALILSETGLQGGMVAAERARAQIAVLEFRPKGQRLSITASVGVAATEQFEDPKQLDVRALISSADQALYAAKHSGRDRVCVGPAPEPAAPEDA